MCMNRSCSEVPEYHDNNKYFCKVHYIEFKDIRPPDRLCNARLKNNFMCRNLVKADWNLRDLCGIHYRSLNKKGIEVVQVVESDEETKSTAKTKSKANTKAKAKTKSKSIRAADHNQDKKLNRVLGALVKMRQDVKRKNEKKLDEIVSILATMLEEKQKYK